MCILVKLIREEPVDVKLCEGISGLWRWLMMVRLWEVLFTGNPVISRHNPEKVT